MKMILYQGPQVGAKALTNMVSTPLLNSTSSMAFIDPVTVRYARK